MMSSTEFVEWLAYYRINPYGDDRGDMQAAIVASTVANVNMPKGKTLPISDFMIDWDKEAKPRQSVQSMQAHLMAAFKAAGCQVIDNREQNSGN